MRLRFGIAALLVSLWSISGCGSSEPQPEFVQRMISHEEYQPPSSASRDTVDERPVLYLKSVNGELRGITNADPTSEPRVGAEVDPRNLIGELRSARQIVERMLPDSLELPGGVNVVLDRGLNFGQVAEAMVIAGRGSFEQPFLITAEGYRHSPEHVRVHPQYGPFGWSAWVWWMPDNSFQYVVWPDEGNTPEMFRLPPDGDTPNLDALRENLAAVMDTSDHLPEPMGRLVGIWAYEQLPYPRLMKLMDALKFPEDGEPVAGRFTFLAGEAWGPPDPDEMSGGAAR